MKSCSLCKEEKETREVVYEILDFARKAKITNLCVDCMAKVLAHALHKLQMAQLNPAFEITEVDSRTSKAVNDLYKDSQYIIL